MSTPVLTLAFDNFEKSLRPSISDHGPSTLLQIRDSETPFW